MAAISIVIVNYNTREELRSCLNSIGQRPGLDVAVVDNASTDGSQEMVLIEFPWVRLLANQQNPGYGAGANQGISTCRSDYVLLLNSDTRLEPQTWDVLSGYLDHHPLVAIVGPRLINVDGSLQASCYPFPSVLNLFVQESGLEHLVRSLPYVRDRYLRTWNHDSIRTVPWVLGAALAIRREAFDEVDGFDESFFMYFEEVDLAYRLRRRGWDIHFVPQTTITHLGGASTAQDRAAMLVQWFGAVRRFYAIHHSTFRWYPVQLTIKSIVLARLVRDGIRLRLSDDSAERRVLEQKLYAWRRILWSGPEVSVASQ